MTYTLLIGEYAYSGSSMSGWLMLDAFGIPFRPNYTPLYSDEFRAMRKDNFPAYDVPILRFEENGKKQTVWDSVAIAETLHERHPDAGLWPSDTSARRFARALPAQMHSGFPALQRRTPMNLRVRYEDFQPTEAEQADVEDVYALLEWSISEFGGPFLCGENFSAADAMFAPMATRLVSYGFEIDERAHNYVEHIYALPSFRRWHACADGQLRIVNLHHLDLPEGDNMVWPRHPVLPGKHYEGSLSDAINEVCPFSGAPIVADSLAEIDGLVVGFCNPFCCRRGMADAASWPTVMSTMGR